MMNTGLSKHTSRVSPVRNAPHAPEFPPEESPTGAPPSESVRPPSSGVTAPSAAADTRELPDRSPASSWVVKGAPLHAQQSAPAAEMRNSNRHMPSPRARSEG